MTKILITGANGFVGSSLVNYLVKFFNKEFRINILIRKTSNVKRLEPVLEKVQVYYGDVRHKESLVEPVKNSDIIVHCAAVLRSIKYETYYEVNYVGTQNLVDVIFEHNPELKTVIYISSQAAAGPSKCISYKCADETCTPVSHYGKSKFLAEQEILRCVDKMKTVILRPAAVYGPYDRDMFIYFQLAEKGVLPVFSSEFYIQFVYIHDLVKLVGLILKDIAKVKNGIYFVAEECCYNIKQVSQIFEQVVGKKIMVLYIPYFISYFAAYINEKIYKILYNKPAVFNRDKLNELVNQYWLCNSADVLKIFPEFEYTPLRTGIKETYLWYKENKWL